MRIASWNIKGVRHRQKLLLDWLDAQKPDLVALSRRSMPRKRVFHSPNSPARATTQKYTVLHRDPKATTAFAIISRRKPRVLLKGLSGQERLGPRLLTVEVDGLEFSSVYAPAATKKKCSAQIRIEWFESLIAHLRATRPQSGRRVLCGDFNVLPECRGGPRGSIGNTSSHRDVQARFRTMLKEAGLFDLYVAPPPGWSDRFKFEGHTACLKFSRLEYVLGTQRMVDANPIVRFDIDYAITQNSIFPWARAPILADLDDWASTSA